jgi:uncharacterized iron-regulated membrane protein
VRLSQAIARSCNSVALWSILKTHRLLFPSCADRKEGTLIRKALFWAHLVMGVAAALVVAIMAITGTLLTYERQMIEWADRDIRYVASTGTPMAPEALVEAVQSQTGSSPEALTFRSEPNATVEAAMGRKTVFLDPSSGKVVGEGSASIRRFFRSVTDWHRWLAMEGPWRSFGRSITGAANLAFFLLAFSGIFLWLPRTWNAASVRAVAWFRGGLSGKARDFNWHNVIGIWCVLPLIAVIAGALVISYPWATNLVYRIAGSEPPAPPQAAPARAPLKPGTPKVEGLNLAMQAAQARVPGWQTISWRASDAPTITLAVAESHRGRVDLKSTFTVDRATGQIKKAEQYSEFSRGRQWRLWLRFIHTGEALGVTGQTIAGIASAGAAVLAWTGLALSWRRWRAWVARRRRVAEKVDSPVEVA